MAAIYNQAVKTTTATFDTEARSVEDQLAKLRHRSPHHPVLVAVHSDAVVGWASLSPWSERRAYDGTAEVSIYIAEEWRGRGVGRRLLRELLRRASRAGLHTILARIAEGNPASRGLHASAGFESVGVMREVGFKFGHHVDVEVMQLIFPARNPDRPIPGRHGRDAARGRPKAGPSRSRRRDG
jgi:L-amino acid N-acyltransferase YncA